MKTLRFLQHSLASAAAAFTVLSVAPLHAATPTTAAAKEFRLQKQWNLGEAGGWGLLALDSSAHRLYIPRANRVMIVDTETGTLLGEVSGMKNVREMALDDTGKYGYVTDPTDGSEGFVRVFDRGTRKLIASVPTGRVPSAIAFDPATKSVVAFNSHDHSATVIDAATNTVTATIPLTGRPAAAIADGAGNIFVTLPALGTIVRIDAAQKKVADTWNLGACTGPASLAIDAAHHQLFTTCEDHKLVSIDTATGHVTNLADAPAGAGDLAFDARHNLLFMADINGTLTILRRVTPTHYAVAQQVKTQPGARTMILSRDDDRAFLVTSKFSMNTTTKSEELQFRPTPVPGTFAVLVVSR